MSESADKPDVSEVFLAFFFGAMHFRDATQCPLHVEKMHKVIVIVGSEPFLQFHRLR